jgi:hypothetical protein
MGACGGRTMNALRRNFTLPELEKRLDQLAEGALLQISARDYTRLFGSNDVAAARLLHFARGHACVASHADQAILFRKKLKGDAPSAHKAS